MQEREEVRIKEGGAKKRKEKEIRSKVQNNGIRLKETKHQSR